MPLGRKSDNYGASGRVGDAESARVLALESHCKHDGAWSQNGWVTATCYAFLVSPEISAESNSVQTLRTFLRMTLTEVPQVYKHAERSHTLVEDPLVHVRVRWIMEKQPEQPSMH